MASTQLHARRKIKRRSDPRCDDYFKRMEGLLSSLVLVAG